MSTINKTLVDQIIAAYTIIRKTNNSIPDEILDLMKNSAIDRVTHRDLAKQRFYEALAHLNVSLDYLILSTPTGEERNQLCDLNIKLKELLSKYHE